MEQITDVLQKIVACNIIIVDGRNADLIDCGDIDLLDGIDISLLDGRRRKEAKVLSYTSLI